jgi:hypothetical protein
LRDTTVWKDSVCAPIPSDMESAEHFDCYRAAKQSVLDFVSLQEGESVSRPYTVGTVYPGNQWGFYGFVDNVSEVLAGWAGLVEVCASQPGGHFIDPTPNASYTNPVYTGNSWIPLLSIMNLRAYRADELFYMNGFRMARDASPEDVENAIRDGLAVGIDRPYW